MGKGGIDKIVMTRVLLTLFVPDDLEGFGQSVVAGVRRMMIMFQQANVDLKHTRRSLVNGIHQTMVVPVEPGIGGRSREIVRQLPIRRTGRSRNDH